MVESGSTETKRRSPLLRPWLGLPVRDWLIGAVAVFVIGYVWSTVPLLRPGPASSPMAAAEFALILVAFAIGGLAASQLIRSWLVRTPPSR